MEGLIMVANIQLEIERTYQCPICLAIETLSFFGNHLESTRNWKQIKGSIFHRDCGRPSMELRMSKFEPQNHRFSYFLQTLMHRRKCLPNQLASDLGMSHATISRWLYGRSVPSIESCWMLSKYSGLSLEKILRIVGHLS
jgi:hypothetical protein